VKEFVTMSVNDAALSPGVAALDSRLRRGGFDVDALAAELDAFSPAARVAAIRTLSARAQAQLYEAVKGRRKLRLTDLVPASVAERREVAHEGHNTLPVFTDFAKVFCRPRPESQELWGYNRTGALIERSVGPGYYVAYEGPSDEVLIDYTRMPEGRLEHWPDVRSNKSRLSRFVYADMIDALRSVSSHVSVGRAIRNGKVVDNWFVLCRT
jgi:hypothetical protein